MAGNISMEKISGFFLYFKNNKGRVVKVLLLLAIFLLSTYLRYRVFDEAGGDFESYRKAVEDFISGVNPYKWTVMTYEKPEKGLEHGYAYLPSLLYIQSLLYFFYDNFHIPLQRLWKLPILATDLGVGLLLCVLMFKKSFTALLFSLIMWFFNPHFLLYGSYTNTEPITIFFVFLSLYFLGIKNKLSVLLYSLAISFKTYPIILIPIFFAIVKRKKLIIIGLLLFLIISIPFFKSTEDLVYYIKGSLLVHGERGVQGRPILSYISYYLQGYNISFLQYSFFKFYVYSALFSGGLLTIFLFYKKKVEDKYLLSSLSFFCFYILTPVLNRTHLMWVMPIYIIAVFNRYFGKSPFKFYVLASAYYLFYLLYLMQWSDGFDVYGDYLML